MPLLQHRFGHLLRSSPQYSSPPNVIALRRTLSPMSEEIGEESPEGGRSPEPPPPRPPPSPPRPGAPPPTPLAHTPTAARQWGVGQRALANARTSAARGFAEDARTQFGAVP